MTEAELPTFKRIGSSSPPMLGFGAWRQLIRNRDTLLLTCAYFAENCIFLSVLYLVLSLSGDRARF